MSGVRVWRWERPDWPDEFSNRRRRRMDDDYEDVRRDPAIAAGLLASLRWNADQQIINHEGEHVWLKPTYNADGNRRGITDCCFVSDPCAHHRALESKEAT